MKRDITESTARSILRMVRHMKDTNMDYMTFFAYTDYEVAVLYNGYTNGGQWEFIDPHTGEIEYCTGELNSAAAYLASLDRQYKYSIKDCPAN